MPPAEAEEGTEGNEVGEEGPGDQVPRKRVRIQRKIEKTDGLANPDDDVLRIHDEKDHESWRQFSPATEVGTTS